MDRYLFNTLLWFGLSLLGAFWLHSQPYAFFALTIAMIWHIAGVVVSEFKK